MILQPQQQNIMQPQTAINQQHLQGDMQEKAPAEALQPNTQQVQQQAQQQQ